MIHCLRKLLWFLALPALAQTANVAGMAASNSAPLAVAVPGGSGMAKPQSIDEIRAGCIENRRTICGKIVKVLPDGLVVDSGYTNLMRPELSRSWLVPGAVAATHPANLLEARQPAAVCVGLVVLTDLPKKPLPKVFDYVVLEGFPTGEYNYTSVGEVRRTVRKFSTKLANAVQWRWDETEKAR